MNELEIHWLFEKQFSAANGEHVEVMGRQLAQKRAEVLLDLAPFSRFPVSPNI